MELDKKINKLTFAKSIDSEKKMVTGYVSTFGWDRDLEKFVPGAWDLSSYMKNPVVLWAHNSQQPPIAKTVSINEDETGLLATAEFDSKSERSMEIFSLFERKFLNAFSVGFIRKSFLMEDAGNGQKGIAITDAELYEYSAVSIPANPGALVSREVAEIAMKTIGPTCIEVLCTKSLGDQFLVLPIRVEKEKEPHRSPVTQSDEFESVLKQVNILAQVAKKNPLPETQRGLITTAMTVFNEIIQGHPQEIEKSDLIRLKDLMVDFAGLVGEINPSASQSIKKTIYRIEKAVTGRADNPLSV